MPAILKRLLPFLTILLAAFLECWLINSANVEAWDEARQGVNSLSMHFTGDWWNYRWLGEPDTFNTKPPLVIWFTALTYRWIGVSLVSLRLHAIIGTFITLFFGYRILKLYSLDQVRTWIILLLLISGRGLIGFHVGRNGDVDALFIGFLTASIFHFAAYWDFGKKYGMAWFAFFISLAFLTKGIAIGLILPGLIAYSFRCFSWEKIKSFHFLLGFGIGAGMLLFTYLWCVRINVGFPYQNGAENLWQAMFLTDGLTRFTDGSFENGYDPFYLFHALDVNFSPYNYLFYGLLAYGLYHYFFRPHRSNTFEKEQSNTTSISSKKIHLIQLSTCIIISCCLILMISTNKHRWYIAPALFWLATLTVLLYDHYLKKTSWRLIPLIVIGFSISTWRVYETFNYKTEVTDFFSTHAQVMTDAEYVIAPSYLKQNIVYYVYAITGEKLTTQPTQEAADTLTILPDNQVEENSLCIEGYCITGFVRLTE